MPMGGVAVEVVSPLKGPRPWMWRTGAAFAVANAVGGLKRYAAALTTRCQPPLTAGAACGDMREYPGCLPLACVAAVPIHASCAVHLVAGSTTSPFFPQIARKCSLKTGSCSHAGSVCSYPVQKTRCGLVATKLGRD